MDRLESLIAAAMGLSLAFLTLTAGLGATLDDLRHLPRRLGPLGSILVATSLAPAGAAMALAAWLGLSSAEAAALIAFALSPAVLLPAPGASRSQDRGSDSARSAGLILLSGFIAPLVAGVAAGLVGLEAVDWPAWLASAGVLVLLPMAAGMAIRRWAARAASAIDAWGGNLSVGLLLAATFAVLMAAWSSMSQLISDHALLAVAGLALACLLAGRLLGGPARPEGEALAHAACVRHPGLAIVATGAAGAAPGVQTMIVLTMLLSLLAAGVWQGARPSPANTG